MARSQGDLIRLWHSVFTIVFQSDIKETITPSLNIAAIKQNEAQSQRFYITLLEPVKYTTFSRIKYHLYVRFKDKSFSN